MIYWQWNQSYRWRISDVYPVNYSIVKNISFPHIRDAPILLLSHKNIKIINMK